MAKPIEALSGADRVTVPGHLLGSGGGEHYVLRILGDALIEEGIHEGDYVICMRTEAAEPGDMVVALVGGEATLKFWWPEGSMVRLQPADHAMQPVRFPADQVRVQAVAVGMMRKFRRGGEK